jgi:putative transposase
MVQQCSEGKRRKQGLEDGLPEAPPMEDDTPSARTARRSSVYDRPAGESKWNLDLMRQIDEQFLKTPWYGSRLMCRHLRREEHAVGRKRIRRLMRMMGLAAIYQRPNTSTPHPEHRIYPYLLKGMEITEPGKVWCGDITYVPMRRGFLYLVAVMDWYSRKVLSWRLSNSLDADFCVEALQEALARFAKPEIFNTDQGCQFTSLEFTEILTKDGVRISMDGRGRWRWGGSSRQSSRPRVRC